jgi:hypothetical protein
MTTETRVRASGKLDVTREEQAFIKRAVEAQVAQLEATTDWPAILPYTKEDVVESHKNILTKLSDLSAPVEVKPRAPRGSKTQGAVAATVHKNGGARSVNA